MIETPDTGIGTVDGVSRVIDPLLLTVAVARALVDVDVDVSMLLWGAGAIVVAKAGEVDGDVGDAGRGDIGGFLPNDVLEAENGCGPGAAEAGPIKGL